MRERPILFNSEMVRAVLDGRKTMTRRPVVWPSWAHDVEVDNHGEVFGCDCDGDWLPLPCPYGEPGDRLWVRETWASFGSSRSINPPVPLSCQIRYHADNKCEWKNVPENARGLFHDASFRLHPSIHMPRWASRITLEVVRVRVERVRDITPADAMADGIETLSGIPTVNAVADFAELWSRVYAARGYGWDVNPLVWVVEFKVVEVKT